MVSVAVVLPPVLEAVTTKLAVAVAVAGVPLMIPVLELRLRAAGRAGITLYRATAPPELVGVLGVTGARMA
jgi:hypothetical protein